jgi:hypothetical protein
VPNQSGRAKGLTVVVVLGTVVAVVDGEVVVDVDVVVSIRLVVGSADETAQAVITRRTSASVTGRMGTTIRLILR